MAKTEDYKLGEFTFPRGWFMIADAEELQSEALALEFFGREFVLYRGETGRVVLLDAYCAHMGSHLAKNATSFVVMDGQIEGDSIRCPYHAWRYGPDGKCDDIPYHDGPIPEAACIKSWPVEEKYGCIFVWHDPEGGAPDYELPNVPEWDDPAWVRWKIDHLGVLDTHPREIIDNIADIAHLGPIHGSTLEYFESEFRGHLAIQRQGGGHKTLVTGDALLETDTWYTGPGVLMSTLKGLYDALILITHTPIADGRVKVWHALLVKSNSEKATAADIEMARGFQAASCQAFQQDFDVWAAKRPAVQILQLKNDGPFHKAHQWYRQFYNPRAQAADWQSKADGVYTVKWMPGLPEEVAAEGHRY